MGGIPSPYFHVYTSPTPAVRINYQKILSRTGRCWNSAFSEIFGSKNEIFLSSRRFLVQLSGRQSADWWIISKQGFLASCLIIKKINWSRSRDAELIFVSTSNFQLPGTIIRVLDPRFQNGTQFWKAEGQLYKLHTKPENRSRHDPTLK